MAGPLVALAANTAGRKVGGFLSAARTPWDDKKDAERQNTARLLFSAAMNGDRFAAAQLRCLGSVTLKPGDLELLVSRSGGKHDASYFTNRCGFASPPARALARDLALRLDSNPATSGVDAGNPATLGTSPMRVAPDGRVVAQQGADVVVAQAGFGGPLAVLLAVGLAVGIFSGKRG
jgi:hypothetical protein